MVHTQTRGPLAAFTFYDRATHQLLKTDIEPWSAPPIFFPGTRKYLTDSFGPGTSEIPLYDLHHTQPLALLDVAPGPRFSDAGIVIAPDGRSILIRQRYGNSDVYHLHQPTGPDCPESTLGLLAFPHVWLLIALLTAATLSLLRDARRSNPLAPPPPRLILWPLTAVS